MLTSEVRAIRSRLQEETHVLHFGQSGFVKELSYSRPEELDDHYTALLASEELRELSSAESGLISLFNEHSDMGDTVAGAALMAGASFANAIQKVQGMDAFAKSRYWQGLALHLLDTGKLAKFRDGTEDQASKFMAGWILARQGNLPEVLTSWREAGWRLARSRGMILPRHKSEGTGRTVAKNSPCPCGSGRRARRCHPAGLP
jgi:hypothetical protein